MSLRRRHEFEVLEEDFIENTREILSAHEFWFVSSFSNHWKRWWRALFIEVEAVRDHINTNITFHCASATPLEDSHQGKVRVRGGYWAGRWRVDAKLYVCWVGSRAIAGRSAKTLYFFGGFLMLIYILARAS